MRTILVATTSLGMLVGAAPPPRERVVSGDGIVAIAVNGARGNVRIDPGAPGIPLIASDFATRAKLKGGGMIAIGLGYTVGPEVASHRTEVTTLELDGVRFKRRVGWGKRDYSPVAEGTIGPADLPEPIIRFVLRPSRTGDRTMALPMVNGGGLLGGLSGLYAQIMVGGQPMRVRFDPWHARTLANAGAGLRLAAAQDGRLAGETVPTEIVFGIERPVRTMNMGRPLALGPLSIDSLGIRTSDDGNATRIADAAAPPERVDPDEIVVTAKGKKRDPNRDRLSIGADYLSRCSSIVFDKPAKRITLTCA